MKDIDHIGAFMLLITICIVCILFGALLEYCFSPDEKNSYIQAIIDVENKVPLKYVRQEQPNKEVIWVLNKEYKKDN